MAILRPFIQPTLGEPQPIVAPPRQSRLRQGPTMGQAAFYEKMLQARPAVTTTPEEQKRLAQPYESPVGEKFVDAPSTGVSLQETLAKFSARKPPPQLNPIDRFKSPSAQLVQPSEFRSYYERLNLISQTGQERVFAEQARSAFAENKRLMDIMNQTPPAFKGVSLQNYNQNYINKSAPLKMMGRVAEHVGLAGREISGRFGINNIGGHATSGHIPGSDHYTGHALDVMVGGKKGRRVLNYALQNAGRLGVKYLIHNRTYYAPSNGWRGERYTGSNPHTGHVHISFNAGGGGGASRGGGGASGNVQRTVQNIAARNYGWSGGEWNALRELVHRESSWNPSAANPSSSARGLFQKMTSIHGPVEGSIAGQAKWGLNYIRRRYGSPSRALAFHNRNGWY